MNRLSLLTLAVVAGLVAVAVLVSRPVPPPPIAGVEPICVDTMRRTAPDLSWVAPRREELLRGRRIANVTLGELPSNHGRVVRTAGVLHVEFEWVGLYSSRAAIPNLKSAPWVSLGSLWPEEPYWKTKGPSISDRCVVVEGTYLDGPGGHFGMFNGTIAEVLRLDVWSVPHRPFVLIVPPPPPAPPNAK